MFVTVVYTNMDTRPKHSCFLHSLLLFFFLTTTTLCHAANDTLSSGQSLSGNQTLVSKQGKFELGFFTRGTSSNCYLGIWYSRLSRTYIWTANRESPSPDQFSSQLKLLENGNLVLLFKSDTKPNWSTGSPTPTATGSSEVELVLMDDGNLVLRDRLSPSDILWQSFDHPTNTLVPGGKLRYDYKTKTSTFLACWKNNQDPYPGTFSLQLDLDNKQYVLVWNGSKEYWKSGSWDGESSSLTPETRPNFFFLNGYLSFVSTESGSESYLTYHTKNESVDSMLYLGVDGKIIEWAWSSDNNDWQSSWIRPRFNYEVFGYCGTFGVYHLNATTCLCLPGSEPIFPDDWSESTFSGGCERKTSIQCRDDVGFSQSVNIVKLPENAVSLSDSNEESGCKSACLSNCSCNAVILGSGCWMVIGDLYDLHSHYDGQGKQLYLKVAASAADTNTSSSPTVNNGTNNYAEPNYKGKTGKMNTYIIVLLVLVVLLLVCAISLILCKMKKKRRGNSIQITRDYAPVNLLRDHAGEKDSTDLLQLKLRTITIATNNFGDKLGEGGYGPVYKGKLQDGQEVAVKRLSVSSGQGIEEFKNELKLISKLQHRNLVRLLGYCIESEEKILVYEYMPNKSLDALLFDPEGKMILDWGKRFNIVGGIARGLLYLHQDSRLKVIHRDLKASNILLDENMIPKISDFGMARIFRGDQALANTSRVVGTYGYMSPEYLMKGIFSEKSDVYSFGVLLLEIVSSKKNTSFSLGGKPVNLLSYAWEMWNEGKPFHFMDPTLAHSYSPFQVTRCIQVSLLCVQEHPEDRPSMSTVISMLGSEKSPPTPNKPPFIPKIISSERIAVSTNNVTITSLEGR